ncbi:MAG: acyl-CoA thioesterase [Gemmatimonadota bacterium]
MADSAITYQGVVYPWHCDHMGHMNVMWYVGKFDEATWRLFGGIGLTPSFFRENDRGMAAVQQEIAYKRELRAGDVAAVTVLTGVHLDTRIRRSCPFPADVLDRGRAMIVVREPGIRRFPEEP